MDGHITFRTMSMTLFEVSENTTEKNMIKLVVLWSIVNYLTKIIERYMKPFAECV